MAKTRITNACFVQEMIVREPIPPGVDADHSGISLSLYPSVVAAKNAIESPGK